MLTGLGEILSEEADVQVSAVSRKTNTTSKTTMGAFTEGSSQVVLWDTPGVVDSR